MTATDYVKRLAVMLFVALPVIALLLAAWEKWHERTEGFWSVFSGAIGMVFVWGGVTGALLSVAHTYLVTTLGHRSTFVPVFIGMVLGLIAGAATPTLFTGFFNPAVIAWGGLAGVIYGLLVSKMFSAHG